MVVNLFKSFSERRFATDYGAIRVAEWTKQRLFARWPNTRNLHETSGKGSADCKCVRQVEYVNLFSEN